MDELEVRELLKKTSFPFLAAYEEEWINAEGKTLTFDEMGKSYLESCRNYLKKQKGNIDRGFFLQGAKVIYDESQYENIVDITKKLYERKLKELDNYL